jgi:hypothetical protein
VGGAFSVLIVCANCNTDISRGPAQFFDNQFKTKEYQDDVFPATDVTRDRKISDLISFGAVDFEPSLNSGWAGISDSATQSFRHEVLTPTVRPGSMVNNSPSSCLWMNHS